MQTDKPLKLKQPGTSEAAKEAAAALRAQLQMELQNLKQCTYKVYECTQLTLEGYNYCQRHILQDKNAPFKQCAYTFNTNGKRCYLPAPKDKKDTGYCNEHALKAHLTNSKRGSRCQPPHTAEVLLHSVSHYVKKPRTRTLSSSTQYSDEGRSTPEDHDGITTKSLNPFVDVDSGSILTSASEILDMCSESESDVDATSYGSVWHDAHAESSDNDSIDSEQEDVLKHANVYSAEEITLITRDKLIRLQSLYIDQYRYLHHMLRERRRRYLYALKREKETCSSIANQIHDSSKEQRMYKKLKAFNSYHRKHGIEAVCNKRLHERRLKVTEGAAPKPHTFSKCVFTEGGVKCGERALPVTRHCRKHILVDPNQVLFRACGKVRSDTECTTPVEAIFDDATCRLHMDIPPLRSYAQIRKDSESDYDDTLEASMAVCSSSVTATTSQNENVKAEVIDFEIETHSLDAYDIKEEFVKEEIIKTEDAEFITSNTAPELPSMNANQNTCEVENSSIEDKAEVDVDISDLKIESHATEDIINDFQMDTDSVKETVPQVVNEIELENNMQVTQSDANNEIKSDSQVDVENQ